MQATKPPLGHGQVGPRQAQEAATQAQREDARLAAAQAQVIADIQRLEAELRALHARAALLAEERRALAAPPQVRALTCISALHLVISSMPRCAQLALQSDSKSPVVDALCAWRVSR